jgi:hypothetical protein
MRPALYILAGITAVLGVAGFGVLLVEGMTWLFGPWGLFIEFLSLLALGGGYVGWSVYRMRTASATPSKR